MKLHVLFYMNSHCSLTSIPWSPLAMGLLSGELDHLNQMHQLSKSTFQTT